MGFVLSRSPSEPSPEIAQLDEFELKIERLVHGGDGIGRFRGVVVFVPRTAPGDECLVRVVKRAPNYVRAEVVERTVDGPDRVEPPCRHYEACGGCDLQHLNEEAQRRAKRDAAIDALERLGGLHLSVRPEVEHAASWGYRLRCQLSVRWDTSPDSESEPRSEGQEETPPAPTPNQWRVGYLARGTHEIVPVEECPILAPALQSALPGLGEALSASGKLPSRLDVATESLDRSAATAISPPLGDVGHGELCAKVCGREVWFSPSAFFQAHGGLLDDLVEAAVGRSKGGLAFDLFSGVGLFALQLADHYEEVVAVEGQGAAVRHARKNLTRNRLSNVTLKRSAVESWIRELPAGAERVLVDPPRRGLPRRVLRHLGTHPTRHLTYVSCEASTLARDLRILSQHGYELEELRFFDLFPQTAHLEAVAQIRHSGASPDHQGA